MPRRGRPGVSEETAWTPPPRATASRDRDRRGGGTQAGGPDWGTEVPGQARRENRADRAGSPKRPARPVANKGPEKHGPRDARAPPVARKGRVAKGFPRPVLRVAPISLVMASCPLY